MSCGKSAGLQISALSYLAFSVFSYFHISVTSKRDDPSSLINAIRLTANSAPSIYSSNNARSTVLPSGPVLPTIELSAVVASSSSEQMNTPFVENPEGVFTTIGYDKDNCFMDIPISSTEPTLAYFAIRSPSCSTDDFINPLSRRAAINSSGL